jgi:regulator of RNase E activity RraA
VADSILTPELKAKLRAVSTATLTGQLQQRGIRSTFLSGLVPVREGQRMVGVAHTLRYVPMREDLRKTLGAGQNAQRRAIESLQPGEVLVIEARGEHDAGTIGDIFAMRAQRLGAAGVITDGALRDTPAIRRLDIPVYHAASHAATLSRLHVPLDHQIPIACAGVTVLPGDVIVGDEEGAVVIPAALVQEVADDGYQQEIEEEWAFEVVGEGETTTGVFPLSDERRPEFEAWLAAREGQPGQGS